MMNPIAVLAMAEALGSGIAESWDAHQQHMERIAQKRRERERIQAQEDDLEYIEIKAKRSKLPASERKAIVRRVELRTTAPQTDRREG